MIPAGLFGVFGLALVALSVVIVLSDFSSDPGDRCRTTVLTTTIVGTSMLVYLWLIWVASAYQIDRSHRHPVILLSSPEHDLSVPIIIEDGTARFAREVVEPTYRQLKPGDVIERRIVRCKAGLLRYPDEYVLLPTSEDRSTGDE